MKSKQQIDIYQAVTDAISPGWNFIRPAHTPRPLHLAVMEKDKRAIFDKAVADAA